uniref:HTH OST-type domain-containing protein n=1 Tax=Acrobeloides nanus TaxID=290746 RepID=A0A914CIJ3_9BILA
MEHHTSRYVSTATGHQRSISETRKPIRGDWRAEAHDYESIRPLRRSDKESLSVSQSLARLKQDLHRILRSKTHYTLHMLAKAWMNETGTNPNEIAASFGFSSFKELLHSNQLKDIVEIDELETSSGAVETLYLAKSIKVTEHVRKPMYEPSSNADSILPDKEFIDQLKAMKEVGTENFIEAKRKILELLAQLGAEESPVTFSNLMQAYLIKYGVPLNKAVNL